MYEQDIPTYNVTLKILERLNSGKPFYIEYLCDETDEAEQDIRNNLAKLRRIRGFPIQNKDGEYSFKADALDLLSMNDLEFIASSIAIHKLNPDYDYISGIQNTFKNLNYGLFALPLREDHKYKEIEEFEPYELSYCIANEMAIRNITIEHEIRRYHYINDLVQKLSFTKLTDRLSKNSIADNLIRKYWISVYHSELDYFGHLNSKEYSKDKYNDLFAYNQTPKDTLLNKQSHFNNNEKYKFETYQKIDFRNIYSDRNPAGFKLSQEYIQDKEYYSSIIPDFHRKILDPNLISVPLNFSLPKEELLAYISHIKDSLYPDEDKTDKTRQVLTVAELLHKERYNDHKKSRRYPAKVKASKIADYLYIYDYVHKRIEQLKKIFLKKQEAKYVECLEEYQKVKKTFLSKVDLDNFNNEISKEYTNIFKKIKSDELDSQDYIKEKYRETLQLYSIYYMDEIENVDSTIKTIKLFLTDIGIVNEQKFELFYKISLVLFYLLEDYKHMSRELRRVKKLPDYKNEAIKKYKNKYVDVYLDSKNIIYKIIKKLKTLKKMTDPTRFNRINKVEVIDEVHEVEVVNLEYLKRVEAYEKDVSSYEDVITEEIESNNDEVTQIESILCEKFLLKQFKQNRTTISDYYYAINPYIKDFKYQELLSGVDTTEERKSEIQEIKDARRLPKERQQEIRFAVMELFKQGETDVKVIARKVGIHPSRIYEWKKLYKEAGDENFDFIKIKQRGRKKGNTLISIEEQKVIIQNLIKTTPKESALSSNLWNLESVQLLINRITSKNFSLSTTRNYMKEWGILVEQKEFIILKWIDQNFDTKLWIDQRYSQIQKLAIEENAEIWWTNGVLGKVVPSQVDDINSFKILSAAKGKKSVFSIFQGENSEINENITEFIDFLENIIKSSNKKKYIIILTFTKSIFEHLSLWEKENENKAKLIYLYEQEEP